MLEAMKTLLKPIHIKLEDIDNRISNMDNRISNMDNRISNVENEITNLRYEMKRGFRKTEDEIETLTEALRAKGILPIAK